MPNWLDGKPWFSLEVGIDWKVGAASQSGDSHSREKMTITGEEGQLVIRDWHTSYELWLVVAAIDDNLDDGENHAYQFQIVEVVLEE